MRSPDPPSSAPNRTNGPVFASKSGHFVDLGVGVWMPACTGLRARRAVRRYGE
jgi:hypothetical protein